MAESWEDRLLAGVARYLAAADVATFRDDGSAYADDELALVLGQLPPAPDRVLALSAYPVTDDPQLPISVVGLQLLGRDGPGALDAAFDALHGATGLQLNGIRVASIYRRSAVVLGPDDNDRVEASANYYLTAQRATAHRPQ